MILIDTNICTSSSVTHSTDTFYGILCSGLTEKTRLSFTSSNSSFYECLRSNTYCIFPARNHHLSFAHSVSNMELITSHQDPHDGKEHTFTDTFFKCKNDNGCGGAIDLTNGGDLVIQRCIFDKCSCTERGGAVSYQGDGKCTQEENLYIYCSSSVAGGAFNSLLENHYPLHYQKGCTYIGSSSLYYAHMGIEFTPETIIDSNRFIRGTMTGTDAAWVGIVVNVHTKGSINYSNCLFSEGNGLITAGLSFIGSGTSEDAIFEVKYCFFNNNYKINEIPYEIYFNEYTSSQADQNNIIYCLSATPNSKVFVQNKTPQDQDWLP